MIFWFSRSKLIAYLSQGSFSRFCGDYHIPQALADDFAKFVKIYPSRIETRNWKPIFRKNDPGNSRNEDVQCQGTLNSQHETWTQHSNLKWKFDPPRGKIKLPLKFEIWKRWSFISSIPYHHFSVHKYSPINFSYTVGRNLKKNLT